MPTVILSGYTVNPALHLENLNKLDAQQSPWQPLEPLTSLWQHECTFSSNSVPQLVCLTSGTWQSMLLWNQVRKGTIFCFGIALRPLLPFSLSSLTLGKSTSLFQGPSTASGTFYVKSNQGCQHPIGDLGNKFLHIYFLLLPLAIKQTPHKVDHPSETFSGLWTQKSHLKTHICCFRMLILRKLVTQY